jgi:hypothetical protein
MRTSYKKKQLQKILKGQLYISELNYISDKLRLIYVHQGYVQMLAEFNQVDDHVEQLFMDCIKHIINQNTSESRRQSAGFMIEVWFDSEDYMNIDAYFSLV